MLHRSLFIGGRRTLQFTTKINRHFVHRIKFGDNLPSTNVGYESISETNQNLVKIYLENQGEQLKAVSDKLQSIEDNLLARTTCIVSTPIWQNKNATDIKKMVKELRHQIDEINYGSHKLFNEAHTINNAQIQQLLRERRRSIRETDLLKHEMQLSQITEPSKDTLHMEELEEDLQHLLDTANDEIRRINNEKMQLDFEIQQLQQQNRHMMQIQPLINESYEKLTRMCMFGGFILVLTIIYAITNQLQNRTLSVELESANNRIETMTNSEQDLKQIIQQKQQQNRTLSAELESANNRIETMTNSEQDLKQIIQQKQQQNRTLSAELESANNRIDTMTNSEQELKQIIQQQQIHILS
eukprot:150370_1